MAGAKVLIEAGAETTCMENRLFIVPFIPYTFASAVRPAGCFGSRPANVTGIAADEAAA